jgi:hypothetical protein
MHIFNFPSPEEPFQPKLRTVILNSSPILHARWNPQRKGSLVACCGNRSIYTWSDEWIGESGEAEEMAECIGVPASELRLRFFFTPLALCTRLMYDLFLCREIRHKGYSVGTGWKGTFVDGQGYILLRVWGGWRTRVGMMIIIGVSGRFWSLSTCTFSPLCLYLLPCCVWLDVYCKWYTISPVLLTEYLADKPVEIHELGKGKSRSSVRKQHEV